jgi:hypothetical protein
MMRNTLQIERPWMYRAHGLLAGAMTLIEAPERQLGMGKLYYIYLTTTI